MRGVIPRNAFHCNRPAGHYKVRLLARRDEVRGTDADSPQTNTQRDALRNQRGSTCVVARIERMSCPCAGAPGVTADRCNASTARGSRTGSGGTVTQQVTITVNGPEASRLSVVT